MTKLNNKSELNMSARPHRQTEQMSLTSPLSLEHMARLTVLQRVTKKMPSY